MRSYLRNNVTPANAATFSGLVGMYDRRGPILVKETPFVYPSTNAILVREGTIMAIFNTTWRAFEVTPNTRLTAANLDTGSAFLVGRDYYVYLVDNSSDGLLVISLNATFPAGQSAANTRRIGGFHFGHIRHTNVDRVPIASNGALFGSTGTIWQNNVSVGIVDNSVWDFWNRPTCSPEGMVKVGDDWVDIYQASAAETITYEPGASGHIASGRLQSRYGQIPVTGTEIAAAFSANELAALSGKYIPLFSEWLRAAYGNPLGEAAADNYGWTKTANTGRQRTGCNVDPATGNYIASGGVKPFAISAYNTVDMVGNLWEFTQTDMAQVTGTWAWLEIHGANKGQLLTAAASPMHSLYAGGGFNDGIRGGSRAARIDGAWSMQSIITGYRLFCKSV